MSKDKMDMALLVQIIVFRQFFQALEILEEIMAFPIFRIPEGFPADPDG